MQPDKDNYKWVLMKAMLDGLRIRTRFAIERAIHNVKYRAATTAQERGQSSLMAENFTGEALHFLNNNLTAKLAPLHPTREQVGVFQFLMNSIEDGSLILKGTEGRVWPGNKPFAIKDYQAGGRHNAGNDLGASLAEVFSGKDAHLTTRWGVHEPFPHGFAVFGTIGIAMPRSIDFITLPARAGTSDEVRKFMGIPEQQSGFTQKIDVYNNGERIVINRDGTYKGENIVTTDQYLLVGAFDGEKTQRTYWLYGNNHNKMSTSQRVGYIKSVTNTAGNI
ncbi:hypothetical protein KAZ57_01495 [Patescibacteria group bacterium]|nr:hypothetical protein [Patescibacteria group bacterium]